MNKAQIKEIAYKCYKMGLNNGGISSFEKTFAEALKQEK